MNTGRPRSKCEILRKILLFGRLTDEVTGNQRSTTTMQTQKCEFSSGFVANANAEQCRTRSDAATRRGLNLGFGEETPPHEGPKLMRRAVLVLALRLAA